MRKDPLPQGMPSALNIELEAFPLKHQHDAPPKQDEGTAHVREVAGAGYSLHARRSPIFGNEIGRSMGFDSAAQPLLDAGGRTAIAPGDAGSLASVAQGVRSRNVCVLPVSVQYSLVEPA